MTARIKSVHREGHATNLNRAYSQYARIGICLIIAALGWSTCGIASSGPGIGIKIGAQTLEDPIDQDKTTRARFEVEVSSPRLLDDHFDLALTFGGSSLGSFTDEYADVIGGSFIEETYEDNLSVVDLRLAARLYPLGDASQIRPYVGAGIGYFWMHDYWEYEYAETFEDPIFPGVFHTIIDEDEGLDTPAEGFFPFVTAGVTFPLGEQGELLFEFQYDFDKEDDGFDLGGPIYMIGARLRF